MDKSIVTPSLPTINMISHWYDICDKACLERCMREDIFKAFSSVVENIVRFLKEFDVLSQLNFHIFAKWGIPQRLFLVCKKVRVISEIDL